MPVLQPVIHQYKCQYCDEMFSSEAAITALTVCAYHEKTCRRNPETKCCETCTSLIKGCRWSAIDIDGDEIPFQVIGCDEHSASKRGKT